MKRSETAAKIKEMGKRNKIPLGSPAEGIFVLEILSFR
jgi:hypothetical protein